MDGEYYGWIFLEEKYPPLNEEVLIAYVDEFGGEKSVEYLMSKYYERTIITSVHKEWMLPMYYKQSCVKAWRKVPPFVLIEQMGE